MKNNIFTPDIKFSKYIFPDNIDYTKLLMTDEGKYSVSGKDASKLLSKIIYKHMKSYDITITDCTANIGSDTLMLAKYYKTINSIEYDKTNYKALKNNIEVYNYKNINLINGDSIIELKKLTQDVIYIDAPWGGSNYKEYKQLRLFLSNLELSEIFNKYKDKTKLFIFKVPYNYNINHFLLKTQVSRLKIYTKKNKENTKILFLFIVISIKK